MEQVYLDLDKYSCNQGDTVRFKAYITQASALSQLPPLSSTSTVLHVNVYTRAGRLLSKQVFPVYRGMTNGQVIFKDSLPTDNYYLVAFTKEQLNYGPPLFSVPVLVYNKEKPASIFHKKAVRNKIPAISSSIKDVTWLTNIMKGKLYSMVEIDSVQRPRHFSIRQVANKDSLLVADINLSNKVKQNYGLFPVDTTKELQTFLLYEDSILIGRQFLRLRDTAALVSITPDTLDLSPGGYSSLSIQMPDTLFYYASITIEDADRSIPSPSCISSLHDSYSEDLTTPVKWVDTSFIQFSGKATREFGKKIRDEFSREIFLAGVKDSNFLFNRVFSIDENGRFTLDSLFFYDSIALQFQINKAGDGRTKDLALKLSTNLDELATPAVDSNTFLDAWADDSAMIDDHDTAFTQKELSKYEIAKMKTLRPVIVKKWKDPRNELDHLYTTGPFSEPALYSYDLRNYTGEYNRSLFWYISVQGGRLHYDPVNNTLGDVFGHPIRYFIDEVEYDSQTVQIVDFDRIAYIKVLESDFLSTARPSFTLVPAGKPGGLSIPESKTSVNVLIYTRKGKDFRTMRGGLNTMLVKGYDRILPFTPDKRTLLWSPWEMGNKFRVHFTNNENCRKLRVKIAAITPLGKVAYGEKLIFP